MLNSLTRMFPINKLFNHVKLPSDLARVTNYGNECSSLEGTQMTQTEVEHIWSAVEDFYSSAAHPMISMCLRRKGKVVLNRAIGHAQGSLDESQALLATTDTPVCLFSASKGITALLVHKLSESGAIDLDLPLAHYIPEFGCHGKHEITVDDLLSHRAQVPSLEREAPEAMLDHEHILDKICSSKPESVNQAYHAVSSGYLISTLIERATGKSINEQLDTHFRQPLGMKYFTYGIGEKYQAITADNACSGMKTMFPVKNLVEDILGGDLNELVELSNTSGYKNATIPAANMYATAEECSRFYQMILNGGHYNDQKIMDPKTIARAIQGPCLPRWDSSFKIPARFSSGLMLGGPPMMLFGYDACKAYGHLGLINIITWADPERDISGSILSTGKSIVGPHLIDLAKLMSSINWRCSKSAH